MNGFKKFQSQLVDNIQITQLTCHKCICFVIINPSKFISPQLHLQMSVKSFPNHWKKGCDDSFPLLHTQNNKLSSNWNGLETKIVYDFFFPFSLFSSFGESNSNFSSSSVNCIIKRVHNAQGCVAFEESKEIKIRLTPWLKQSWFPKCDKKEFNEKRKNIIFVCHTLQQ